MAPTLSRFAFKDIEEAFERALGAQKGIAISCKNRGVAVALRARFHYWRKLNRQENCRTYELDHPMYNASIYDALVLRIPPRGEMYDNVLYVEHRSAESLNIEEIKP